MEKDARIYFLVYRMRRMKSSKTSLTMMKSVSWMQIKRRME